jgi:hypothetical protein
MAMALARLREDVEAPSDWNTITLALDAIPHRATRKTQALAACIEPSSQGGRMTAVATASRRCRGCSVGVMRS